MNIWISIVILKRHNFHTLKFHLTTKQIEQKPGKTKALTLGMEKLNTMVAFNAVSTPVWELFI